MAEIKEQCISPLLYRSPNIRLFFTELGCHSLASQQTRRGLLARSVHYLHGDLAWAVNLRGKPLATYFGGSVTVIGMLVPVGVRRAWFLDLLCKFRSFSAYRRARIVLQKSWSKTSLKL